MRCRLCGQQLSDKQTARQRKSSAAGGTARAASMTPERRSEIARNAALAKAAKARERSE